ncbi:hypothetical protein AB0J52_00320 [Spirillospora sp. NPDC049652]
MTTLNINESLAPEGTGVFWLDEDDDRDRASDRVSRYGAYLRQNPHLFNPWGEGLDTDPARFTAAAWQVATSPIMAPPYLRCRWDRLMSATILRAENGSALAHLELVTALPRQLDIPAVTGGWNTWAHNRSLGTYLEPSEEQMAKQPTLLPRTSLVIPLPSVRLHKPDPALAEPRSERASDLPTEEAKCAVATLAALLNHRLAPIVSALEYGRAL